MSQPYDPDFVALVSRAVRKKREGKKLSRVEQRAVERYTRDEEQLARQRHYADIPKGEWAELSGRQHKVLDDQFRRYGVPVGGKSINLADVARWLHNLLANHGPRILEADKEQATGEPSAIEQVRLEKLQTARLARLKAEGELVSRGLIHEGLGEFASRLRQLGEEVQRVTSGAEAAELVAAALDDCERIVQRMAGGDNPE
jgi:hypothetical protein